MSPYLWSWRGDLLGNQSKECVQMSIQEQDVIEQHRFFLLVVFPAYKNCTFLALVKLQHFSFDTTSYNWISQ